MSLRATVPTWEDAAARFREGGVGGAELTCAFIVDKVRRSAGVRWLQGRRRPPLHCVLDAPIVRLLAEHRLARVPEAPMRALVAWANGERQVTVRSTVPAPADVLALQARGVRCVSLLEDDQAPTLPNRSPSMAPLDFVLHDLCHLDKFTDPRHFVGQVGFFGAVERATQHGAWAPFCARFDEAWECDFAHVVADMNGCAIFLCAALKMKLKMAVRRRIRVERGEPPAEGGKLDSREASAYAEDEGTLLDLLGLRGALADAARGVTTRRDAPGPADALLRHFEALGTRRLAALPSGTSP